MEKPGMEGRFIIRRGLLMRASSLRPLRSAATLFACFAIASFPVNAESATSGSATGGAGPEEPLTLLVSVSPERPSTEAALVVSILVDYADPERATVRPPILPAAFSLERVRSEPRLIRGRSNADERWTAIEFTFSIQEAGEYVLGPFEVEVPLKRASTEPLSIRVVDADGSARATEPAQPRSLEWRSIPAALRSGEAAEVYLEVSGGAVSEATVSAAAPENALLESLPLLSGDRSRGIVARFRLTALSPPGFRLPAVVVTPAGENALQGRGGWVPVSPGAEQRVDSRKSPAMPVSSSTGAAKSGAGRTAVKPPFPELANLSGPLSSSLARPAALARAAWDRGDYAIALAVLRTAERDTLVGFAVAPLRREAERALGMGNTPDEAYAPAMALIALAGVSLLIAILIFFFSLRVTSGRRRGYMVAILFLALSLLSLGRLLAIRLDAAGFLGSGIAAVAPACVVYRIPEQDGGIATEFVAGQPVRLRNSAGSWIYAEAPDGQAGWIEGDRMIRY